eukprot:1427340-Rhodomonas_salina.4
MMATPRRKVRPAAALTAAESSAIAATLRPNARSRLACTLSTCSPNTAICASISPKSTGTGPFSLVRDPRFKLVSIILEAAPDSVRATWLGTAAASSCVTSASIEWSWLCEVWSIDSDSTVLWLLMLPRFRWRRRSCAPANPFHALTIASSLLASPIRTTHVNVRASGRLDMSTS